MQAFSAVRSGAAGSDGVNWGLIFLHWITVEASFGSSAAELRVTVAEQTKPVAITMAQEEGDIMSQQYAQVLSQLAADVEEGIDEAYRAEGYVDDDGNASDEAMRAATFQIIMDRAVASSKAERSRKAITKGELYALVFPSGPTDDDANKDPVKERVLAKLASVVWGLTQTTRSGYVQRQFETEDTSLVLCRCKVYRNAEQKQAIYATNTESMIQEDAVDNEIKALARRASALRKDLNMIIERHPKMRDAIAAQLGLELQKIDAELALGDGSGNGSKKQIAA